MKKISFLFFLFCILALPSFAWAITLNVPIGETTEVSDFSQYVALWYGFVLGAVGIIAAVMIMWGGFKWLVSRGEPEAIRDAKERIIAAITGLVLAFLSYTILSLINPRLVNLSMPELKTADFSDLGLDANEGKPITALPRGTASANINDLNSNTQQLHASLMEASGGNPRVTSTRRTGNPGSQHYTGNAIDYSRDDEAFNNYMESLIRQGKPEGSFGEFTIYRVTFPNGESGRIIDEYETQVINGNTVGNVWHADRQPPKE